MSAKPFLRWCGGKGQLLPELLKRVPQAFGTYHEPFLGGGALFFALQPHRAALSDMNEALVSTYWGVREYPAAVADAAAKLVKQHSSAQYYDIRSEPLHGGTIADTAIRLIYLNKTCFNGLWRVNKSGRFNVPVGKFATPPSLDTENLAACSTALRAADIGHEDFRGVEARAQTGDFVYFDPPYVPVSDTADFTTYTKEGFGPKDQLDLRDLALRLKQRGVHVLLSNAGNNEVMRLYNDFHIEVVQARRNVNSKAAKRGPVSEFLIR